MQLEMACEKILQFDQNIRYAGFADSLGKIVAERTKSGITLHLTKQESDMSIIQATMRVGIRRKFEPRLGKMMFSYTHYEMVKRISIPLFHGESENFEMISPYVLLLSLETACAHEELVLNKILPFLDKEGFNKVRKSQVAN